MITFDEGTASTPLPDPAAPADGAAVPAPELPDVPAPLAAIDVAGKVLALNPAGIEQLGAAADTAIGASCEMLLGVPPAAFSGERGVWSDPAGVLSLHFHARPYGWLLCLPDAECGALRRALADFVRDGHSDHPALAPLAQALAAQATAARLAETAARQLASCDLHFDDGGADGAIAQQLRSGFGHLSEAVRQSVGCAARVAQQAPAIAQENAALQTQSEQQAEAVDALRERAHEMSDALEQAHAQLHTLARLAGDADQRAVAAREFAETLKRVMHEADQHAQRINGVIDLIDHVAFQTNILSVNAAIEAAHAGELGRGFAVVAQEVRSLAQRAAQAARDVRGMVEETRGAVARGGEAAAGAEQTVAELGGLVERTGKTMHSVADAVNSNTQAIGRLDAALEVVAGGSRENVQRARRIAEQTNQLERDVAVLDDSVRLFRLSPDPLLVPRHRLVHDAAHNAARAVAERFEHALRQYRITAADLFSPQRTPIAGTKPQKFSTPFDALCDELLPPVQEPVLASDASIVFAICAAPDGYVPTHNLKFSQPLTGKEDVDLVGNRTKRIFSDRVGRSVGAHTDPYRLQVYRRDTGEILFDLSVPILIGGRHWGGFRIGYRL